MDPSDSIQSSFLCHEVLEEDFSNSNSSSLIVSGITNLARGSLSNMVPSQKRKLNVQVVDSKAKKVAFTETVDINQLGLQGKDLVDYFKENGPRITSLKFSTTPFIVDIEDLVGNKFVMENDEDAEILDMLTMIECLKESVNVNNVKMDIDSSDIEMSSSYLPWITAWVKKQTQLVSMEINLNIFDEEHVEKVAELLYAASLLKNLTLQCVEMRQRVAIALGKQIPLIVDSLKIVSDDRKTLDCMLKGLATRTKVAETTSLEIDLEDESFDIEEVDNVFRALKSFIKLKNLNLNYMVKEADYEGVYEEHYPNYFKQLVAMTHLVTLNIHDLDDFQVFLASRLGQLPQLTSLELGYTNITNFAKAMVEPNGLKELRFPRIMGGVNGLTSMLQKLLMLERFFLTTYSGVYYDKNELAAEMHSQAFQSLVAQRPSLKIEVIDEG